MPTRIELVERRLLHDAMVEGWQGYMECTDPPSQWTHGVFSAFAELIQHAASRDPELATRFSQAFLGQGVYANEKLDGPARLLHGAYLDALLDNVNDTGALPKYQRLTLMLLLTVSQWESSVRSLALATCALCRILNGKAPATGTLRNRTTVLVEKTMMRYRPRDSRWEGVTFGKSLDDFEMGIKQARKTGGISRASGAKLASFANSLRGRGRGGPVGTRSVPLDRLRNAILHGDFDVRLDGGIELDVAHSWRHWLKTGKTRRVRALDATALAENLGMARGLLAMVWGFNNAMGKVGELGTKN